MYILTEEGKRKATAYLKECDEQRKRILNAGEDTAEDIVEIWNLFDIEYDLNQLANGEEQGVFENAVLVTDNIEADHCLRLLENVDYKKM